MLCCQSQGPCINKTCGLVIDCSQLTQTQSTVPGKNVDVRQGFVLNSSRVTIKIKIIVFAECHASCKATSTDQGELHTEITYVIV